MDESPFPNGKCAVNAVIARSSVLNSLTTLPSLVSQSNGFHHSLSHELHLDPSSVFDAEERTMFFLPLKQIIQHYYHQHYQLPPEVALHPHLHEEIILYHQFNKAQVIRNTILWQTIYCLTVNIYIFELWIVDRQP